VKKGKKSVKERSGSGRGQKRSQTTEDEKENETAGSGGVLNYKKKGHYTKKNCQPEVLKPRKKKKLMAKGKIRNINGRGSPADPSPRKKRNPFLQKKIEESKSPAVGQRGKKGGSDRKKENV